MKTSTILAIAALSLASCCGGSTANASGVGNYSSGYRMGQVTKFSIKGMFMKSGEGQMLVGSESTPYIITSTDSEGNTSKKTINPWYFSVTDEGMRTKINNNLGEYVVMGYNQHHIKMPNVDTEYEITSVGAIGEKLNKVCSAKTFTDGSKGEGTRVGRIVKASVKGTMVDSFEVMMQQGNSGNQFKNMSISKDKALFDCATAYLKAGQKVKITYDESIMNLNVFGRDTSYDIVKIEPFKPKGLN